jgi:hypothetical protein
MISGCYEFMIAWRAAAVGTAVYSLRRTANGALPAISERSEVY